MKKSKIIIYSLIASIVTAVVFSSLVMKASQNALISKFREVEIFNNVGRVEAWNDIEQLLEKGCTKEALSYIKYQKSSILAELTRQTRNNQESLKVSEERKEKVLKLMKNNNHSGYFQIPKC